MSEGDQTMNEAPKDVPDWDVALEALLAEECRKRGGDLSLNDLRLIAASHGIRLDDILDTLCQLTLHAVWDFHGTTAGHAAIDEPLCKLLKANHRLNDEQLKRFEGAWRIAD